MKIAALLIVVLALVAFTNATSICDTYTPSGKTNADFITDVVQGVFGAVTASGTPTVQYFNGTTGENENGEHVDFLFNSTALDTLAGNLVAFFGVVLGCSDGTTGSYNGEDMQTVHENNDINKAAWEYFNQQLVAIAQSAGFSHADYSTLAATLESLRAQICTASDCFTSPYTITVGQGGLFFNPAAGYSFPTGATIEWVWYGDVAHSVQQSNSTDGTNVCNPMSGGFNSGSPVASPHTFSNTFNTAGVYYFYCTVPGHCSQTGMWGTITITGSSTSATAASTATAAASTAASATTKIVAGSSTSVSPTTTKNHSAASTFAVAMFAIVLLFALWL